MKFLKSLIIIMITPFFVFLANGQEVFDPANFQKKELTMEDLQNICTLRPTDEISDMHIPFERNQTIRGKAAQATANIIVEYVGTDGQTGAWPQFAINAFEHAVEIWESHIYSDIPIRIIAIWNDNLPELTLGSAGPLNVWQINEGKGNPYYHQALASAITGVDLVDDTDDLPYDILVNMNANFPYWYYGLDAQTPDEEIDFVTVVLHELGHGLGFSGSMGQASGGNTAEWGYGPPEGPAIYDQFVMDGGGNEILDTLVYPNNSQTLFDAVRGRRGGIEFTGLQSIGNYDGRPVSLYAPDEWSQGSSYSHVDQRVFTGTENALMRPQMNFGLGVHDPGPIVCAMFSDMGWPLGEDCLVYNFEQSQFSATTMTPEALEFGVINEREVETRSIAISSSATAQEMLIGRISYSMGNDNLFRISPSDRFIFLNPGETMEIPVQYRPRNVGQNNIELRITHNATGIENPIRIAMSGEALEEEVIYVMEQNYPNPFNSRTTIPYALSQTADVRLDVYNALGRHVQTLVNQQQPSGRYNQTFQAGELASGLYFYRIIVDGQAEIGKLLYTK
ncbi:MAG: T9SS type A sorting domain-containing protein [Gracilimonas sp.]|nr:T9SS type A sorting domain-containing protein [Gracilimonas sp.]